jgi:hypothetical protein
MIAMASLGPQHHRTTYQKLGCETWSLCWLDQAADVASFVEAGTSRFSI